MKKTNIPYEEREENAFSLSTGDLMAGLLFIFVLLLMSTLLRVVEMEEKRTGIVNEYNNVRDSLYIDLQKEFENDLVAWKAEIDSSLVIRFKEPSTLFDYDKSVLKPEFKEILNNFFLRYIKVLREPKFKDHITEIRIEGHTDSKGEYFYNMELSQNRTRAVLQFCFNLIEEEEIKEWAKKLITANGLSSSRLILNENRAVNDSLSRRVEFCVRTDAERQLEKIMKSNLDSIPKK